MYGYESWTWQLKNWCFWIVVLEKTLESPLDNKEIKLVTPKGNQPWMFIGRTHAEIKLQYFGQLMQTADSLEKTLMLRKTEVRGRGHRAWDGWMASLTQWTWVWANSGRQWRTGKPGKLQSMGSQRIRHDLAIEQQQQHFILNRTIEMLHKPNSTIFVSLLEWCTF